MEVHAEAAGSDGISKKTELHNMKTQHSGNSGILLVPDGNHTVSVSTGPWTVKDVRRHTHELHEWRGYTTVRMDENEFGAFLRSQEGYGEAGIQFVGRDNNTGESLSGPIIVADYNISPVSTTVPIHFVINGLPTVSQERNV